jgi:hypothetical protein
MLKTKLLWFSLVLSFTLTGYGSDEKTKKDLDLLPSYDLDFVDGKPSKILIGDKIRVFIKNIQPSDPKLSVFKAKYLSEDAALTDKDWLFKGDVFLTNGRFEFEVVPLKAGVIPLNPLLLETIDGKPFGKTYAFEVTVGSFTKAEGAAMEKPPDFLPPIPFSLPRWIVLVGIILVVLIVISTLVYLVFWIMARNRRPVVIAPERVLTADEKAIQGLVELLQKQLWEKGQIKKHYFGVSEILKQYLESRYKFNALESTTEEMLATLSKVGASPGHVREISDLFTKMDLVKFADRIPASFESRGIVDEAIQVVRKSKWV